MQLVALSNLKLNNDMFSNRSLSIHRRILVKNFLTLLYRLNPPMDWEQMQSQMQQMGYVVESSNLSSNGELLAEDEKQGWMEQTLNAAGLGEDDDHQHKTSNKNPTKTINPRKESLSNGPASAQSRHATSPQKFSSSLLTLDTSLSPSGDTPLPRPKSAELPQSLHSYLSTVFDVNWSVELSSTEDLLFTNASSTGSVSSTTFLSSASSMTPSSAGANTSKTAKRKSLLGMTSSTSSGSVNSAPGPAFASGPRPGSSSKTPSSAPASFSNLMPSSRASASSTLSTSSTSSSASTLSTSSTRSSASSMTSNGSSSNPSLQLPNAPLARKSSLSNQSRNGINKTSTNTNAGSTTQSSSGSTQLHIQRSVSAVTAAGGGGSGTGTGQSTLSPEGRNIPMRKQSISGASKPMLVPGRRSSLLQTGQMPTLLNSPTNNANQNRLLNPAGTLSDMPTIPPRRSPTLSPSTTGSSSASLSPPTTSPSQFSSGHSPTSPTSPNMSPGPRMPSNEIMVKLPSGTAAANGNVAPAGSGSTASSGAGLPRPLLTTSLSASSFFNGSPSSPSPSSSTAPSSATPTLAGSPLGQSSQPHGSHSPQQQQLLQPSPYPYLRSVSDDGLQQARVVKRSPSPSPTLSPASTSTASSPQTLHPTVMTYARPSQTYVHKASKSTPNLLAELENTPPAIPDKHSPQQPQNNHQHQQPNTQPSKAHPQSQHHTLSLPPSASTTSTTNSGLKLLTRVSSRRIGSASTPLSSSSSSASGSGYHHDANRIMDISAPLPLIPQHRVTGTNNASSYQGLDFDMFEGLKQTSSDYSLNNYGHTQPSTDQYSPYSPRPFGQRPGYTQSLSNVSIGNNRNGTLDSSKTSILSTTTTAPTGSSTSRWTSMKSMLGLRVGQGAKG
ncbi:hypothetical protein BGW38_005128, partial [Lunasporangiospora selenospora]